MTNDSFLNHLSELDSGDNMGQEEALKAVLELFHKKQRPLTYDEIAKSTNISKNNVSKAIRKLRGWREVDTRLEFDKRGGRVVFVVPTERAYNEFLRQRGE